ncbi:MAG: hypothetical protein Hyperionvirus19_13 [Hyperionvirus sp.]|uniref:Uncharacterized protein n=1 Tax=Hyperionvirus sp. TaxID=2487770 RepID=A0A3G5AFN2_9VIRU|nr:MAG: hypothetical protein Hyperionvirus19_13 [Hyperionvirus sp.]
MALFPHRLATDGYLFEGQDPDKDDMTFHKNKSNVRHEVRDCLHV